MSEIRSLFTELEKQNYPDNVLNPGRIERSLDPHGCLMLSSQRTDEYLIRNRIYSALRQHAMRLVGPRTEVRDVRRTLPTLVLLALPGTWLA